MKEHEIYNRGMEAYHLGDYYKAKSYFGMLLNSRQYRFKALRMLVKINYRQYRYDDVRRIIEEEMYLDNFNTIYLLANLERSELNFKTSIDLFEDCKQNPKFFVSFGMYMDLVSTHICYGEFNKAREIIREYDGMDVDTNLILFKYILIDFILGNYERAHANFKKIDESRLDIPLRILWDKIYILLNFNFGNDLRDVKFSHKTSDIFKNALYDEEKFNEDLLVRRINISKIPQNNDLAFAEELDALELIKTAKDLIKKTNPLYHNFMELYSLRLPYNVGYDGEMKINSVCVSTVMGTDKIISIVPALFSDEFDREGMSHDKDLRKRLKIS